MIFKQLFHSLSAYLQKKSTEDINGSRRFRFSCYDDLYTSSCGSEASPRSIVYAFEQDCLETSRQFASNAHEGNENNKTRSSLVVIGCKSSHALVSAYCLCFPAENCSLFESNALTREIKTSLLLKTVAESYRRDNCPTA